VERDLLLEFWDSFHISGMTEARNLIIFMQMQTTRGPNEKNAKLVQRCQEKVTLLKCFDPLHISGTGETRKFKFGTQIDRQGR